MNDRERLEKYINDQGLGVVFQLLVYQIKLAEARHHLIGETSKSLKLLMLPNNSSGQKDAIINIQVIQLDLISKLLMFIEDYLSYSYYLRTYKNELHLKILSHENVVWKEIEHLKGLDENTIRKYLLLPDVKNLTLRYVDKQFVKDTLRNFLADIYERIKEITLFYEKHSRIYIKYKHIFSPLIGTIYKEDRNGSEIPRIFLRDMDKKIRRTYILSTDNETVSYYEKLGNDISTVFSILLDCHVHSILNCGRDFLIPDINFQSNDEKSEWSQIVRKVNTFTGIPPLTLRINVKDSIRKQVLEGLAKDHIFKYNQDIFEHQENSFRLNYINKK